jgi:hypothetical protein
MKQKIVEVPEDEIVVTFLGSHPGCAGGIELEKDLAIEEQREELKPGKTVLPPQRPDALGRSQRGQDARNPGIDDLEQRGGAWRFQHHVVGALAQVGEPRQDENVGVAELQCAATIGPLRFDHHLLLRSRAERHQETMPGQPADQSWTSLSMS